MIVLSNEQAAEVLREAHEAGKSRRMARAAKTAFRAEREELKSDALRIAGFAGGGVTSAVLDGLGYLEPRGVPLDLVAGVGLTVASFWGGLDRGNCVSLQERRHGSRHALPDAPSARVRPVDGQARLDSAGGGVSCRVERVHGRGSATALCGRGRRVASGLRGERGASIGYRARRAHPRDGSRARSESAAPPLAVGVSSGSVLTLRRRPATWHAFSSHSIPRKSASPRRARLAGRSLRQRRTPTRHASPWPAIEASSS